MKISLWTKLRIAWAVLRGHSVLYRCEVNGSFGTLPDAWVIGNSFPDGMDMYQRAPTKEEGR